MIDFENKPKIGIGSFTATEIAEELSLSSRTVEGYKRSLLTKSGTRNVAGLVIYAIRNHLFDI